MMEIGTIGMSPSVYKYGESLEKQNKPEAWPKAFPPNLNNQGCPRRDRRLGGGLRRVGGGGGGGGVVFLHCPR